MGTLSGVDMDTVLHILLLCFVLQGTCRNSVCVCTPGYSGTYCEVPPTCGVILDVNGNCCNHGIVSSTGVCCGTVGLPDPSQACQMSHRTHGGACETSCSNLHASHQSCLNPCLQLSATRLISSPLYSTQLDLTGLKSTPSVLWHSESCVGSRRQLL